MKSNHEYDFGKWLVYLARLGERTMPEQQEQRRKGWTGNSKQVIENSAMLGGKWWDKGDKLLCIFQREFTTRYGLGYAFLLVSPSTLTVSVDKYGAATKKARNEGDIQKQITQFSVPPLAGIQKALQSLQANGFDNFRFGDKCQITCFDIIPPTKDDYDPSPEFEISVDPR